MVKSDLVSPHADKDVLTKFAFVKCPNMKLEKKTGERREIVRERDRRREKKRGARERTMSLLER